MPLARPLLPYAFAGLAIAATSIAAVVAASGTDDVARVSSTGGGRAAPELSPNGRIAYWRQNPSGSFVLWAANFDGSSPRPLISLPQGTSRPFATRWSADGRAVAFVGDLGISLVALDGTRSDFPLPASVRNAGYRVIDHRWAPSGGKVAATVFRSTDARSEIFFANRERPELTRLSDLANAFVGDWISDDEALVETTIGVIGLVNETGGVRRIFDQRAASPVVDSGRVYFLAGPIVGGSDAGGIFVTSPAIWSVAATGGEARREDRLGIGGDLRLDGRWPDGRYLLHVRSDSTQFLTGAGLVSFKSPTTLRRVVLSADKRSAIGLGGGRLLRIDLSRGFMPAESAFSVLLDGVIGADVWVRRSGPG